MSATNFTSLIVTYNSSNDILNLLDDLHDHAPAKGIIVIDNASMDGTVGLVENCFPDVTVIQNCTNLGYAKAVNQGFALCTTEYVLLLNPDIRIDSPGTVRQMEKCIARSRKIAAVAPLQFKNNGQDQKLNFTWSYLSPRSFRVYLSLLSGSHTMSAKPVQVSFLNAGCLFIRRSAFNEVGKFNEKYFLYGEEPDLFLKFKKQGFDCYLLPNVAVTHYREHSLETVPLSRRLQLRLLSVLNVVDALVYGWAGIVLDRIWIYKPKKAQGN